MKALFRQFPFLRSLLVLAILLALAHTFLSIRNGFSHRNVNRLAAKIRDMEASRTAYALTKISEWKNFKGIKTFRYEQSQSQSTHRPVDETAPGVTFAILAPNRRTHEIDAYDPFYLTETLTLLIESIYHDLDVHGKRFRFVNITLCPTTDNIATFSELNDVSFLLPHDQVKPRLKPLDKHPIYCRTLLDVASCLVQSSAPTADSFSYTILLEDDMMPEVRVMNQLWGVLTRLKMNSGHPIGAVQLHTPPDKVAYSLSDGQGLVELLAVSSMITLLLFIIWLRIWYRPFMLPYNLVLVCSTLLVSAIFASLVGRISWLTLWHRSFGLQTLFPSPNPEAAATGAAVLFPAKVAYQLGETIQAHGCTDISSNGRSGDITEERLQSIGKASVIREILGSQGNHVWGSFPNLFKHRGLYSIYKADVDPLRVE